MKTWNIYYANREYAWAMGDPLLLQLEAGTKEDAESLAGQQIPDQGASLWATEVIDLAFELCPCCRRLTIPDEMWVGNHHRRICKYCIGSSCA